jgi:hypothetical protein
VFPGIETSKLHGDSQMWQGLGRDQTEHWVFQGLEENWRTLSLYLLVETKAFRFHLVVHLPMERGRMWKSGDSEGLDIGPSVLTTGKHTPRWIPSGVS